MTDHEPFSHIPTIFACAAIDLGESDSLSSMQIVDTATGTVLEQWSELLWYREPRWIERLRRDGEALRLAELELVGSFGIPERVFTGEDKHVTATENEISQRMTAARYHGRFSQPTDREIPTAVDPIHLA